MCSAVWSGHSINGAPLIFTFPFDSKKKMDEALRSLSAFLRLAPAAPSNLVDHGWT